ncbi:MAG: hypothetical protein RMJ19_10905, partial [Gemmatales bacterium]|nr:hypothetical protein [Gemmatales bacterium]MDW8176171.1 hypothetical protein [Gemmatales bacterium]
RARYYDVGTGRWTSEAPGGFAAATGICNGMSSTLPPVSPTLVASSRVGSPLVLVPSWALGELDDICFGSNRGSPLVLVPSWALRADWEPPMFTHFQGQLGA